MEEYLKKFASQFNINSELPQKSSFQLNGFKCIYDRSFFEFSLSHLNKNKTNFQSEPTKYLKLVNYLSLFMKDSEKIKLRDYLKKHFILEVDFENEEKNSLVYKNQGFKNDIITFLKVIFFNLIKIFFFIIIFYKCCESKRLERIQEILELFNKKYGYNITDIFKFCLTNNKLLRVIPELSDKIINILQSLKEIKIISSFTFDLLKGDKIKSDLHNRRFNDRRLDAHMQFIKVIKEHEITEFELANMDNLKLFVYDIIVHEYDLKANGLEKAKFITFGSYSNGFALKNSDVDAMIITDNYVGKIDKLILI